MNIAILLQQSKDEHLAYREALPRRVATCGGSTIPMAGDAELAGIHLVAACRFRAEAHVLDPQQLDPAWLDEAASHDHVALLDFYVAQLIAEPVLVQAAAGDVKGAIQEAKDALLPAPIITPVPVPVDITPSPILLPPTGVIGA